MKINGWVVGGVVAALVVAAVVFLPRPGPVVVTPTPAVPPAPPPVPAGAAKPSTMDQIVGWVNVAGGILNQGHAGGLW